MASTINATPTSSGLIQTADNSGVLALQTGGTTAVTVDGSQNVVINGTTAINSSAGRGNITINGSSNAMLNFGVGGVEQGYIYHNGTDILFDNSKNGFIRFGTNGTERMRIDSSGNVLINTTSNIAANAKLFVQGNGTGIAVGYGTGSTAYRHIYMNSGDGTLYFFNPTNYAYLSAAGAWTNASDARLKKNIADIKYGLADVLKAQPRSYEMNSVDGEYVGFIAQELQQVIPEVVTGDPEKQLGVDYGSLVAVAFKAIQELNAKVDAQALEIQALKGVK